MHNVSKYTVPTSFVGIAVTTKAMGMLVVSALPTKVVVMLVVYQSIQIQEYNGVQHCIEWPISL